ncbi:MAG: tail fiber domain-containing protein [Panacibacter sp.]
MKMKLLLPLMLLNISVAAIAQTNKTNGAQRPTSITQLKLWSLTGNAGTDPSVNFIGTTDAQPLVFKVFNQRAAYLNYNGTSAFGYASLASNTTGSYNTSSGAYSLYLNTNGSNNAASGAFSLFTNSSGSYNTATGFYSLVSNTTGAYNAAFGNYALNYNATGNSNVAIGTYALFKNTTNSNLVAIGDSALYNNIAGPDFGGQFNTGIGSKALYANNTGSYNTAVGFNAMLYNTTGTLNTVLGANVLGNNTTGTQNTATGVATMVYNTTGSYNTAFGINALWFNSSGSNNTGCGNRALFSNYTGNDNTVVGGNADVNADGYAGSAAFGAYSLITASNQVRIGSASVASIGGYKAWTNISDGRVKKNIKENVPGLAFINLLKPVTYNLDLDAADKIVQPVVSENKKNTNLTASQKEIKALQAQQQIVCTGFIAQEVEEAAKKIGYDFDGVDAAKNSKDLYGLRYSEFVVPLVKAVQELSSKNEALLAKTNEQQRQIDELKSMVQQLTFKTGASISTSNIIVTNAALEQNVPNPFSNTTSINYTLPQKYSTAQIIIYDKTGNALKYVSLSGAGKGKINIETSQLASGAYSYSLLVDGRLIASKQMEHIR